MPTFQGFLYFTLTNLRSKSEAPQYFLQSPRDEAVSVVKQSQDFLPDTNLHGFCGRKVKLFGTLVGGALRYTQVELAFPNALGGNDPPWPVDAALSVAQPAAGGTAAPVTLSPGDLGPDVLALQRLLAEQGIPNVPQDGFYGHGTVMALRVFQEENGLPATGLYDDATRAILALP